MSQALSVDLSEIDQEKWCEYLKDYVNSLSYQDFEI